MLHSSNYGSKSTSSGSGKDRYIYEIPRSQLLPLFDHLDSLNVWNQLAEYFDLKPAEVQSIRRQEMMGKSATEELLKIWGGQYNHSITELYFALYKNKIHQGMRLLKHIVERKYHYLIPQSQPAISRLINGDNRNPNKNSEKILNNGTTSSGVTDSNNYETTDNNNTSENSETSPTGYVIAQTISSIPEINYFELVDATQNWSDECILGKGGFGTVYRGKWKQTYVAIKLIHYANGANGRESAKVQLQQSLNELKYLNSCRHDNILPLYGYSIRGEKPCLVYQLMKGGSLEQRLNKKGGEPLRWQQRINICLGTARGINYLHTFRETPLIHGDIKPANVLLDECLTPKIGDFGLAREGPNTVNSSVEVTQVYGTKPYLPPEFLNSKKLSTQVDTYSFGVVLLEAFTGLRAYDRSRSNLLLTKHVLKICNTSDFKIDDLIDKNVPMEFGVEDMCRCAIKLGIQCIAPNPQQRPSMEDVLKTMDIY